MVTSATSSGLLGSRSLGSLASFFHACRSQTLATHYRAGQQYRQSHSLERTLSNWTRDPPRTDKTLMGLPANTREPESVQLKPHSYRTITANVTHKTAWLPPHADRRRRSLAPPTGLPRERTFMGKTCYFAPTTDCLLVDGSVMKNNTTVEGSASLYNQLTLGMMRETFRARSSDQLRETFWFEEGQNMEY